MHTYRWNSETDENLVVAIVRNQQSDAFSELYERYRRKVLESCLQFQQDMDDAQDLVQDIFVKVYERLHSFNFQSKFSTWLFSITQRHCIDWTRVQQRRGMLPLLLDFELEEMDFESRQEQEEMLERVFRNFSQLPKVDQNILELKYIEQYSVEQIQEAMGLESKSAVKMRLLRARKKLLAFCANEV